MFIQKTWAFLLVLAGLFGNFESQAIAQYIDQQRSENFIIGQRSISTQWSSRYSVQKVSWKDDRVEWILQDTCRTRIERGSYCFKEFLMAIFVDSDGVAIRSEVVFLEGYNSQGRNFRAYVNAPLSVLEKTVKIIVK